MNIVKKGMILFIPVAKFIGAANIDADFAHSDDFVYASSTN
jgi:hypothetical protein